MEVLVQIQGQIFKSHIGNLIYLKLGIACHKAVI